MDKKILIFEKMPVWKAVSTLAIPAILSQLVTMIYNLADTYYIGQTNDYRMVAAVSYSFGAFMFLAAIGNLFGIGGGSLMARMMGEKREHDARRVAVFSIFGAAVTSLGYSVLLWIFMDPILTLLGASAETIGFGRDYLFWTTVAGGLPAGIGIVIGHLLRSEGSAKLGAVGIALGGLLNIVVDPIFIFVLDLDVAGAAIATMLSNVVALLYYVTVVLVLREKTHLSFDLRTLSLDRGIVRQVFAVGLPAAAAVMLAILANSSMFKLLSGYGDLPVAAMGIVKKIDTIPLNVAMGLAQGVLPLVGYNYAAKNYDRMKGVSRFARRSGAVFALLCIAVFELVPAAIVRFFIDDPETVATGTAFLRIACLGTLPMALFFLFNTTLQAMGKGRQSFLLVVLRQAVINLAILFSFEALFGITGIGWTQPVADVLAVGVAAYFFERIVVRLKRETSDQNLRSA